MKSPGFKDLSSFTSTMELQNVAPLGSAIGLNKPKMTALPHRIWQGTDVCKPNHQPLLVPLPQLKTSPYSRRCQVGGNADSNRLSPTQVAIVAPKFQTFDNLEGAGRGRASEKAGSMVALALPLALELRRDSSTWGEGLWPNTMPVARLSGGLELPLELAA